MKPTSSTNDKVPEYNTIGTSEKYLLDKHKIELEAGWLGKFFGSAHNAPVYIAGIIAVFLVITGTFSFFIPAISTPGEIWKIIAPLISLALGYMFGKKVK